jgi:3',5'-cyclic AMP phosphodiesterase CpdA
MAAYYATYMGAPYGSFTYGNSTFIALNTEEIPPPGTPKVPNATGSPGYVSATQMSWLKTQLDQSINQDNVFIFMHHPIYGALIGTELRASCAKQIVDLVKNYPNVAYIIGGHEHHYFNPQTPSNFTTPPQRTTSGAAQYVVTGGAGAPLLAGGFHHYLVFTVSGKQVGVQLVKVN